MTKLPVVSGKQVVKTISLLGYRINHQTGSHIILRQNASPYSRLTIPNHRTLAKAHFGQLSVRLGLLRRNFLNC